MVMANAGKNAVMLAAGPFVGLLYVVLLPFAGIVAAFVIIAKQLAGGLVSQTHASFGWRPVESYLAGRRNKKTGSKDTRYQKRNKAAFEQNVKIKGGTDHATV